MCRILRYPGTDLTVTTVGLGSSHFGTETDSETSFRILDAKVPEDALRELRELRGAGVE